jgi:hypothetical protein
LNLAERLNDFTDSDALNASIGSAVLPASEMVCVEDHHLPWEHPQHSDNSPAAA